MIEYNNKEKLYSFISKKEKIECVSIWMIASKTENNRWILLNFGGENYINSKYCNMCNAFYEVGFENEIEDLYILDTSDFNIKDINKCLNNISYITNLIETDIFWKNNKEELCLI